MIKILTKLQAFHIYEKIKRNKHCVIPVNKFVKDYHPIQKDANKTGDNIYGGVPNNGTLPMTKQQSFEESEAIFDDEIQSSSEEPVSARSMQSGKASCCDSPASELRGGPDAQKIANVGSGGEVEG